MNRITMKDLELTVKRINDLTGSPQKPYAKAEDGNIAPQAGCYHLSGAYGGWQLHRMSLQPGCSGVTTALYGGYVSKRDLYNLMHAFIRGLEVADR